MGFVRDSRGSGAAGSPRDTWGSGERIRRGDSEAFGDQGVPQAGGVQTCASRSSAIMALTRRTSSVGP
jgi:hypothetical protein